MGGWVKTGRKKEQPSTGRNSRRQERRVERAGGGPPLQPLPGRLLQGWRLEGRLGGAIARGVVVQVVARQLSARRQGVGLQPRQRRFE